MFVGVCLCVLVSVHVCVCACVNSCEGPSGFVYVCLWGACVSGCLCGACVFVGASVSSSVGACVWQGGCWCVCGACVRVLARMCAIVLVRVWERV